MRSLRSCRRIWVRPSLLRRMSRTMMMSRKRRDPRVCRHTTYPNPPTSLLPIPPPLSPSPKPPPPFPSRRSPPPDLLNRSMCHACHTPARPPPSSSRCHRVDCLSRVDLRCEERQRRERRRRSEGGWKGFWFSFGIFWFCLRFFGVGLRACFLVWNSLLIACAFARSCMCACAFVCACVMHGNKGRLRHIHLKFFRCSCLC